MGKYTLTKTQKQGRNRLFGDIDWNDYGQMLELSSDPIMGWMFANRAEVLRKQELQRKRDDRLRNLGLDPDANPYPITSGYYDGQYSETFEVTQAIMNLYGMKRRFRRW